MIVPSDCARVVEAWLQHGVIYSQTPKTKQFVTHGKGLYRPDCPFMSLLFS